MTHPVSSLILRWIEIKRKTILKNVFLSRRCNAQHKIKETIMLTLLNVALPSVDVYSDIALVVNFLIGSRKNPYCDVLYPEDNYNDLYLWHRDRLNCYYNDSMPTTNVTNTSHYGWAAMMFVPFLFNYLICWYVWAITGFTSSTT